MVTSHWSILASHWSILIFASHWLIFFKVLLGEHRIDDNSYTIMPIKKITDDPKYNNNNFKYDFSILELAEPVTFSASIAPACMPAYTSKVQGLPY